MDPKASLLCCNKGCGQRFVQEENSSDSCIHHPGVPVFHDAYKGWSCCNKKTRDFTEFLNIKGCTKSFHDNVKPPEAESKAEASPESKVHIKDMPTPLKTKPIQRPSGLQPIECIKFTITGSLKTELQKLRSKVRDADMSIENAVVSPGTNCKNGGCRKSYENECDNFDTCIHHPGVPVFHEGMKFWTCCMRKTTDFDSFLEQAGCSVGKHLWTKVKLSNDKKQSCRYDWYQTGPYIYVSIYSKLPFPEESIIEGNSVKLHIYLVFGEEREIFEIDLSLFGVVDVAQSLVQYSSNKVEIKLKKGEAMNWTKLTYPDAEVAKSECNNLEENLDESLRLY